MTEDDARDRIRELLVELRACARALPARRVLDAPPEVRELLCAVAVALEVMGVRPDLDG
jgi:hypothetical protein